MRKVYDFLRDLQENNSKKWMHDNKEYYESAKSRWIEDLEAIYSRLAQHDPKFNDVIAEKTVMRINNNLMYHPDKPIYKDYFASSPWGNKYADIYLHISPNGNFIGGGLHNPKPKTLKKLRSAIHDRGDELQKILNNSSFVDCFGGLAEDDKKLKTSPKGYSQDHPHIELLRRKDFVAAKDITQKEVISGDYIDTIETAYLELKPLNDFFESALK